MIRTIEEVREHYQKALAAPGLFCFESDVLAPFLPEGWKPGHEANVEKHPLTEEFVRGEAIAYLTFAFGKAIDHRGISAGRSVDKMRMYCWLLGLDEAVAFADDKANYPNYGVPILKHVAQALGVTPPPEIVAWEDGFSCKPGCDYGCGR